MIMNYQKYKINPYDSLFLAILQLSLGYTLVIADTPLLTIVNTPVKLINKTVELW